MSTPEGPQGACPRSVGNTRSKEAAGSWSFQSKILYLTQELGWFSEEAIDSI
jgi:hypothetical protein